jgi:hypothetical protein
MAEKYNTLAAALNRLENAKRTMGHKNLYRIVNTHCRTAFRIAAYSPPVISVWTAINSRNVEKIDGQARTFLGYF